VRLSYICITITITFIRRNNVAVIKRPCHLHDTAFLLAIVLLKLSKTYLVSVAAGAFTAGVVATAGAACGAGA